MRLSKNDVVHAVTNVPKTTNFRHLLRLSPQWLKRATRASPPPLKATNARDRIKCWNIVPGDFVRLRGEADQTMREVQTINRFTNRVALKTVSDTQDIEERKKNKNAHYSRCQLFMGDFEFPIQPGATAPELRPVFAVRLGRTAPKWNTKLNEFTWTRFALKTDPVIPHREKERIPIPWPAYTPPKPLEPTIYDTRKEDVLAVTYKPPPFALNAPIPRAPLESEYLKSLFNPDRKGAFGDSPPVEVYLEKELSNPHSRAKRQARWQAYHKYKKTLLAQLVQAELKNLNGRSSAEARAEAIWRWQEELERQKADKKKRRWRDVELIARKTKKRAKKEKKAIRQRQRLTDMVLREEPNQVIPAAMKA